MKTASWFTFFGEGRVGISLGVPRVASGFRIYRQLAPIPGTLKLPYQEFCKSYNGKLAGLDAQQEWDRLHQMCGAAEPVLLCWEKPPFRPGNWCHRRLTAEWFEKTLGHVVEEIGWGNCPHMPTDEQNAAIIAERKKQSLRPKEVDVGPLEDWIGRTTWHNGHSYEVVALNQHVLGCVDVRRDDGVVVTVTSDVLAQYFT